MLYFVLCLVILCLIGVSLFFCLKSTQLTGQLRQAIEKEQAVTSELKKIERYRDIPNVLERAKTTKANAEARLAHAQRQADFILSSAVAEAKKRAEHLQAETDRQLTAQKAEVEMALSEVASKRVEAREALKSARAKADNLVVEAEREAKSTLSKARKEAKAKLEKVEETLDAATRYAKEIRQQAEQRVREIDQAAVDAKGKVDEFRDQMIALKNQIERYEGMYLVPPSHLLDELASEFAFSDPGKKLAICRERTAIMKSNGTAATCGYSEGWKRDHALKFVLSTFDGKVDSILSRVKAGNQGRLIQEIKDTFALVNKDGEVYKNARIEQEYLSARLEELKWAVAVRKLQEKAREEQRALREQLREEERARKEIERAIKQAEREEEIVNKAIEKIKRQFEQASEAEKARLEAELQELNTKLTEAEERGKKAISMAQQTKRGHVYVISNIGSFGENVYKIGLTRRLDPTERVKELGDASVPFPFDVHAMIVAEDAPALENALHRRFVERQVNKVNKRKEFFRVSVEELRRVIDELGVEASWTIEAEAAQYRETLALEKAMSADTDLRKKWLEEQATFEVESNDSEDLEEVEQ